MVLVNMELGAVGGGNYTRMCVWRVDDDDENPEGHGMGVLN